MARKTKAQILEKAQEAVSELIEKVAEEEESKQDRIPGKVVRGVKTPWTVKDMDRTYGITTFTPEETIPITISGIKFQLFDGIEITCPAIVKIEYDNYRRKMRRIGRDLVGKGIQQMGGGPLPPEV